MKNQKNFKVFREGKVKWNKWRTENPAIKPNLRNYNFYNEKEHIEKYEMFHLEGYNFDETNFSEATMRDGTFLDCTFGYASMNFIDVCYANFINCKFKNVRMRVSKLGSTTFENCSFESVDFSYCSAKETKFLNCKLVNCNMSYINFVKTDFSNSSLLNCRVYGISSWDLVLKNTIQRDLIITDNEDENPITVDNIEMAQFLYLIINNANLRFVLETLTTKTVLILGRFTQKRITILRKIKSELRKYNYVPILYDFNGPSTIDITETVQVLASMSKYIIADLTDAKSIGHELKTIVPNNPSVIVQPLILEGEREYSMFEHFTKFPWVLGIKKYKDESIIKVIEIAVEDCNRKRQELQTEYS
ncbi:pentapeptide repeat-containing protein [Clostridium sp. 'deep sea']|uniref:pentapeptide repeat-containing protein n=1 Tax=Clostridium sp. 'deep sea' TaxID=2779445 RepID=UPI0018966851|nr:pentapeptide repeat-containing protein [Clostridium sp. 'deep sea']QOR36315.1 pentapeptide repeat-containing protein [Clostridium sp. 'deep sea']